MSAVTRLVDAIRGSKPVVTVTVTAGGAWAEALADPKFRASLAEGLADVEAGRVKPISPELNRLLGRPVVPLSGPDDLDLPGEPLPEGPEEPTTDPIIEEEPE